MKRLIALTLTLVMLLGAISVSAVGTMSDTDGHWAKSEIDWCLDMQLMQGTSTNTFQPELDLSRAMFAVILYRLTRQLGREAAGGDSWSYTDVADDMWYTDGIKWAVYSGIMEGYSETVFGTADAITREQAATVLYRYMASVLGLTLPNGLADTYPDADEISSFATNAVNALSGDTVSLFRGYDDGCFYPLDSMSRAEAAVLISRTYQYNNVYGTPGISVYIEPNTVKYLQQQQLERNGATSLTASMGKNEAEGMQFILNFSADAVDVNCSVSDLSNANGEKLEKVELFRQHYVHVDNTYPGISGQENEPAGMYPDALIPMFDDSDGALDNRNINVTANDNQGYWLTATAAENQSAGVYHGTVTINYNGTQTVYLPVSVTVWDFTVPTKNSCQTAFTLWYASDYYVQFKKLGDNKFGYQMEKMYYDFFLNYRVTSTNIPMGSTLRRDTQAYADLIEQTVTRDEVSAYNLPIDINGNTGNIDVSSGSENMLLLNELKERGLLDKAYIYNVDEPQESSESDNRLLNQFAQSTRNLLRKVYGNTQSDWHEYPLPVVVTAAASSFSSKIKDWCPLWHQMTESRIRQLQAGGSTVWWYGCGIPAKPYPTYHIPDILMSSRLVHWMQRDTGATGELYWATTLWGIWCDDYCDFEQRDVWTSPYSIMRSINGYDGKIICNEIAGDGFLVYPGTSDDNYVGRNVPVPTIRLEAIRDGFEDYEYLTMLEDKYEAIAQRLGLTSVSSDDIMDTYYEAVYHVRNDLTTDSDYDREDGELMLQVREQMAKDIMRNRDDAIVSVSSLNNDGTYDKAIRVYADEDANVFVGDEQLTGTEIDGCYVYTFPVRCSENDDITSVDVYVNGEKYTRILNLSYGK